MRPARDAEIGGRSVTRHVLAMSLRACFADHAERELACLARVNKLLESTDPRPAAFNGQRPLAQVKTILVSPSENIPAMALDYVRSGRFRTGRSAVSSLLRCLAARGTAANGELLSYILYDPGFAEQLIGMSRRDARALGAAWLLFWMEAADEELALAAHG